MAELTGNPGGDHAQFPGRFVTQPGGGPMNLANPTPPGRHAFASAGTPTTGAPPGYTDTTSSQQEPRIPYLANVQTDRAGRVGLYQQGEFLFSMYQSVHKSHILQAKSLWDLNASLAKTHKNFQDIIAKANSPENALELAKDWQSATSTPRFAASVLDDENFFSHVECGSIQSLNRFEDVVDYVGVTLDPSANHVNKADDYSKASLVRNFVCNAEGRTKVPNIFRATKPGDKVGLIAKRFTNPMAFANEDSMTWADVVRAIQPIQVWPVLNTSGHAPLGGGIAQHGMHQGYFGAPGATFLNDRNPHGHRVDRRALARLPDAAMQFFHDERDPAKISNRYWEYRARLYQAPGSPGLSLDTRLVAMNGHYIHLGEVRAPVGKVPTVAQVAAAVAPCENRGPGPINAEWIQLLTACPIEIHTTAPPPSLYRSRFNLH